MAVDRVFWTLLLIFLCSMDVSAEERLLVISQSTRLQLSAGFPVKNTPGSKPGSSVVCERIYIHGLSRIKNLRKISHSVKVKVSQSNESFRLPRVEVCFHRNASIGIGMCPQGQWEKLAKGSWVRYMSPFDHKLLDIRTEGSSLEALEVSIEEEFRLFRIILLGLGVLLMCLASSLSNSLVFYYSSAMAIGVILIVLVVLFQGMKLLPTGRKNSLAIFIYSSVVGLGSFFLRYVPGLLRSILVELGIGEEMYNPLAMFLLAFVVLAGAWLGFWVVRKLVLTEDGSVDISTSKFVAWSIRIVAALMILQSSLDPLMAAEALISGIMISLLFNRIARLRFFRHLFKNLFKSTKKTSRRTKVPDLSPVEDSHDEYVNKIQRPEDFNLVRPQSKRFTLASCNSPMQGLTKKPLSQLSDSETYCSTFHKTPERRKFSKDEWETFTKGSTKKALEQLVSSPDFSKWAIANAERLTLAPNANTTNLADRRRKWFLWF